MKKTCLMIVVGMLLLSPQVLAKERFSLLEGKNNELCHNLLEDMNSEDNKDFADRRGAWRDHKTSRFLTRPEHAIKWVEWQEIKGQALETAKKHHKYLDSFLEEFQWYYPITETAQVRLETGKELTLYRLKFSDRDAGNLKWLVEDTANKRPMFFEFTSTWRPYGELFYVNESKTLYHANLLTINALSVGEDGELYQHRVCEFEQHLTTN